MSRICEACENARAHIIESCDDDREPYQLCTSCHHRLLARALRPSEWYNLAKRHGCFKFLLHDDFYEQDGTATQPEEDVESPSEFPAPTFESVAQDPAVLLDYSMTRWNFTDGLATAWDALPQPATLATLSKRFATTKNVMICSRILEICTVLRAAGAEFVVYAWGEFPGTVTLPVLARASAACLPLEEGINRVTRALESLQGTRKRELMFCLGYFHSPTTLNWIEKSVFSPVTDDWGRLAADSAFDWPRAEQWLAAGRPLSHVAIAALEALIHPLANGTYRKQLLHPPTEQTLRATLSGYAARDPVPRVENGIRRILANASRFIKVQ